LRETQGAALTAPIDSKEIYVEYPEFNAI
jgi:hypothetical protein